MQYLNELFPPNSWLRTVSVPIGIGTGILFSLKYALSFRRPHCKNNVSLLGKTCVVTGANTGIGKAVAFEFAKRQARVILACRDTQKGNAAADEIRRKVKSANVEVYKLDLALFDSIRDCAQAIEKKEQKIDILVNNAGIMACPYQQSKDGLEMQFAVNHLGHFLFTNLLFNAMSTGDDSRIIVVASSLYKKGSIDIVNFNDEKLYNSFKAYGRSKLANILFSRELNRRMPTGGSVVINSMHPGVVHTELVRHNYLYKLSYLTRMLIVTLQYFLLRTPDEGAQTIIYMATEPALKGVSGKYFGDCKLEGLAKIAENDQMGEKLWEMSEKLTGFKWQ